MYVVLPQGVAMIKNLTRQLDMGLLTRNEWAQEVQGTVTHHYALVMNECGMKGCKFPAMWRALSPESTVSTPLWVRLCAGCAEWHTDALCLEPIHPEGVYLPEADIAVDRVIKKLQGFWKVTRNGETYDTMVGYGYPWAVATLRWLCNATWVKHGSIEYTDLETRETMKVMEYHG